MLFFPYCLFSASATHLVGQWLKTAAPFHEGFPKALKILAEVDNPSDLALSSF
jgi:hypothetical protein